MRTLQVSWRYPAAHLSQKLDSSFNRWMRWKKPLPYRAALLTGVSEVQVDHAFPDPQPHSAGRRHLDEGQRQTLGVARKQRGSRIGQVLALSRDRLPDHHRHQRSQVEDVEMREHRMQLEPPENRGPSLPGGVVKEHLE